MPIHDDLRTLESRLATFEGKHQLTKRRASNTKKKATSNTVSWPHKVLSADQLARAGFYYHPSADHDDNVTCFFCEKSLDSWAEDDNPAIEHLSHVPDCAWAINVCIEHRSRDMNTKDEDPTSEKMTNARTQTFKGAWPYENKKGWTCTIKKLVEAGWSYYPEPGYDDCTHCFYCDLKLNGWEPKDDPWQEHEKRNAGCPFFDLVRESKALPGKPKKSKNARASRASKTSRVSTQSNITIASDALTSPDLDDQLDDLVSNNEDSIVTTTSTASKGRKGRARSVKPKATSRARAPKRTQKIKDTVELSIQAEGEPPVVPEKSKKRATRQKPDTRQSQTETIGESDILPSKKKTTRAKAKVSPNVQSDDASQLQSELDASIVSDVEEFKVTRGKKRTSDGTEKSENSSLLPKQQNLLEKYETEEEQQSVEQKVPPKKASMRNNVKKAKAASMEFLETDQFVYDEAEATAANAQVVTMADSMPSPTNSAQSSDAENHPPSSRPSLATASRHSNEQATRQPLKAMTPNTSPIKRNVVAGGLSSVAPWKAVDLENVFLPLSSFRESFGLDEALDKLTSPEKKMGVEEWILWNAKEAEERLRDQCEMMIGKFEVEGLNALQAMEGIECS